MSGDTRDGLTLFRTFVPHYRAWTGANPIGEDENSLTTRYDQQRGMNVEPLRAFATALSQELRGRLGDHVGIQQARFAELPSRWSDSPGADSAAQFVRQVGGRVAEDHDALTGIARAVSAAADNLEEVVRIKADAIRTDFSTTTLAGRSGEQVDRIIAYARGDFGGTTEADERTRSVREVLPEFSSGSDPKTYCTHWLDKVFVPAVEAKVTAFTGLTDATHAAVGGLYDQVCGALESLSAPPFPPLFHGAPTATTAASVDAPDSPAQVDDPSRKTQSPTGKPTQKQTPRSGDPTNPAVSDYGTAGVWRPGDITNVVTAASKITGSVPDILAHLGDPLKAVGGMVKDFGEAAKGFGEFGRDIRGGDGITGLVEEGAVAAEKIDGIAHRAGAGNPTGTGQAATTPGVSVPASRSQPATAPAAVDPGASTTPAAAASSGGMLGGFPHIVGGSVKSDESEHRPKIRYVPPTVDSEPEPVETEEAEKS
ncbi:hypothetical protein IU500_26025 [Nocardia terpenica]|uniref:hypothetical protein n=1 Tax=Nocardia terpenica TaxID=455432 RepID=UPI0018948D82|nr:hypothetical protein [Nocardia terpenica]MBF6061736.1 hypothetical protein [Nocardia terpenica]MBF6107469.1 hypothetical protein [Nocardia terpenica]MBF6110156.1 hypothetical protein [Nocardia terpenica]MBF6122332.1 hypothetical protein [Nocardia terpenica]MBF6151492.1 hypothetical protein [Nocardia terpenica]